jgi:hypothetical protein
MNSASLPGGGPAPASELRRSHRFTLLLPLRVEWTIAGQTPLRQDAYAREVSAHGGVVQMSEYPVIGQMMCITNPTNGMTSQARAVALRYSPEGEVLGVAVELLEPSETFWGMSFRIKKASNDLVKLEEALRSGGIDQQVLRDFRDAVDYVRKTAWVVYEWQDRQLHHRDTATVLPMLASERVRRAIQLAQAIAVDMDARRISADSPAITDLIQAVDQIQARIAANPNPGGASG